MPLYRQTYRSFDGELRRHCRWAIVVDQELRILIKNRIFAVFCIAALLHFLLRLFQVVAYDIIMQNPNNPLTQMLVHVEMIVVKPESFFDFLRMQAPLVFVTTLYAGAGMICNDFRNNLMAIYFSKPIRWYDYMLGKFLALLAIAMLFTAVPATLLVVLHNLFVPSAKVLQETYWWPLAIVKFSLLISVPCALGVLASSAMMKSQNFAAVAVVMLLAADSAMSLVLSNSLQRPALWLLSFPLCLNHLGQDMFYLKRSIDAPQTWPIIFVVTVTALSAWVVLKRIRRAELAG